MVRWGAAGAQGLGRRIQPGQLQQGHSTVLQDSGASGNPPGWEGEATFLLLWPLAIGVDNVCHAGCMPERTDS